MASQTYGLHLNIPVTVFNAVMLQAQTDRACKDFSNNLW
jgi:hypothetical protein